MDRYTFFGNILQKVSKYGKRRYLSIDYKLLYKKSRMDARKWQTFHVKERGRSIIDSKLKKQIKEYCGDKFGDPGFWPWLAVYTEIRGEFREGWIPYDYYRFNLLEKLNTAIFSGLSSVKTFDYWLFNNQVIRPEFIHIKGRFYESDGTCLSKSEFLSKLKKLDCELVLKPDGGSGGKDIQFVHSGNFAFTDIRDGVNVVIQKSIQQHHILDKINPSSVNTFRVLTHLSENGDTIVKFVFLRFGVRGSRFDNISKGGGWVYVDEWGNAGDYSYDLEGFRLYNVHPDTGIRFSNLSFPFHSEIKKLCLETHLKLPYLGLIGWDVYVNKEGLPKLIEWNAKNPFFWPVEARYGPFWPNDI